MLTIRVFICVYIIYEGVPVLEGKCSFEELMNYNSAKEECDNDYFKCREELGEGNDAVCGEERMSCVTLASTVYDCVNST